MPKKEVPINSLSIYLPDGTYLPVLQFLHHYKVHLTVSKERKSILGDYRHSTQHKNHRISVNGNLNKFSFLVTLLHELAHLVTFDKFGRNVASHGIEWKKMYGQLLQQFIEHKIFPNDIQSELMKSLRNPAASSCAEDGLLRVLRKYDTKETDHKLLEDLNEGMLFQIKDGRIFKKGKKLRKRFKCEEVSSGRLYLFSPVYEVSSE
jgi:predicted SprT family Zn-dependent metalloprotease